MLKVTGYILLAVVLIGAGLFAAAPAMLDWVVPKYLESDGIEAEFRFARPSFSSITIGSAHIQTESVRLKANNLVVRYSLASLLQGRVSEITIDSLDAVILPADKAGDTIDIPSPWMLLPADRVRVRALHIENTEPAVTLSGNFEFDLVQARARLVIDSPLLPAKLDAIIRLEPTGGINVTLRQPDAPVAIQLSGIPEADTIFIEGSIDLADELFDLLARLALPEAPSGHLRGTFSGTAPWPIGMTLDPGSVTANGEFDLALSGNLPGIDNLELTGGVTVSLASGNLQLTSERMIVRADSVVSDDSTYRLGEDSRLEVAFNGSLPIGYLGSGFLAKLDATIQTRIHASLSSEAEAALVRHGAVSGELTTTLANGRVHNLIGSGAEVDLGLPEYEVGFRARAPFGVYWDLQSGGIYATDASLEVRIPEIELAGQRLAFRAAQADIAAFGIEGDAMEINGRIRATQAAQAVPLIFSANIELQDLSGAFEFSTNHRVSRALLTSELPGWRSSYDLDSGTIDMSMAGKFHQTSAGIHIAGRGQATLTDGTAHFGTTVATGIGATLPISIDGDAWRLGPGNVDIAAIDAGLPVIDVRFNLDTDRVKANISNLSAGVLGGEVVIEDLTYQIEQQATQFDVNIAGVSLPAVLVLAAEDLDGSGILDGVLPITLSGEGLAISGGSLAARPPGGHLQYRGSIPVANPGLDLAVRALRNFSYEHMTINVDYAPEGELDLMVRLEGRSPDVEKGRPIHFNLNISQNIPALLESLRASDTMSDRVQQRLSR